MFAFVVLLAPTTVAHIDHPLPRTVIQENRVPELTLNGTVATVDLRPVSDPLRDLVRHTIDPPHGTYMIEHRPTGSDAATAFRATVTLSRLVEYRDANNDLRFDPAIDTLTRSWRMEDGSWKATAVANAAIGRVPVKTVSWAGNLTTAGPRLDVTLVAAGQFVRDEGAIAVPNDVILYLDLRNLPPRPTGHLHALDGSVAVQRGVDVTEWIAPQNVTTAVLMREGATFGYFQWGGEAVVDGRERLLEATLADARETAGGSENPLRISFPIMDRSARLVLVEGLQHVRENKRSPGFEAEGALAALALVAVGLLRRSSR